MAYISVKTFPCLETSYTLGQLQHPRSSFPCTMATTSTSLVDSLVPLSRYDGDIPIFFLLSLGNVKGSCKWQFVEYL